MASATIVSVTHDGITVTIAVRVIEGGTQGTKEYVATMLLSDLNTLATNAQKKAALVAAVKVVRDATLTPVITDLSAVASGTVTI